MTFVDRDNNGFCDHAEEQFHNEIDHDFTDRDGDGLCDYTQDGSNMWHGMGGTTGGTMGNGSGGMM